MHRLLDSHCPSRDRGSDSGSRAVVILNPTWPRSSCRRSCSHRRCRTHERQGLEARCSSSNPRSSRGVASRIRPTQVRLKKPNASAEEDGACPPPSRCSAVSEAVNCAADRASGGLLLMMAKHRDAIWERSSAAGRDGDDGGRDDGFRSSHERAVLPPGASAGSTSAARTRSTLFRRHQQALPTDVVVVCAGAKSILDLRARSSCGDARHAADR